ncbi:MAG: hypothetical protein RR942_01440 [Romboutsia sp.]
MSREKYPIGTELITQKDYELKGFSDDKDVVQVKKGDKILVTNRGLEYITGNAVGNITLNEDIIDKTKYDTDNITLRITDTIISFLGDDFKDFMEWHSIKKQELMEEVLNELDYFI